MSKKPACAFWILAACLLLILACSSLPRALGVEPPAAEQPRPQAGTSQISLVPTLPSTTGPAVQGGPSQPSAALQAPPAQRTFYVAPDGDDTHPGTRAQPWANPGFASRRLQPGDELIILGGRYLLREYDADILAPPPGAAEGWIIIRGEAGSRPVLAGGDNLISAVDLSGAQYLWMENLEITHDDRAQGEASYLRDGIQIVERPAGHIVLKDLYIHHVDEFGMNFQDVDDLQIIDSRIEYSGFGALGGPAGQQGGWRNVRISGCSLSYGGHYYQGGDGSARPYDRPDGFGIEPSDGPIEIDRTIAAHNYGDGFDSKAANTTIHASIAANNSCDGVKLWGDNSRIENTLIYGRGDGDPETTPWSAIVIHTEKENARFELQNVTLDDAAGNNYLMHVQYDTPQVPITLTMRNSILRGAGENSPVFIASAVRLTAEHNLFYLPQSDCVIVGSEGECMLSAENAAGLGAGNLFGDPLFAAPAWGKDGDYHLRPGSPALNAGTVEGAPAEDLEGRARGDVPDLGVYED